VPRREEKQIKVRNLLTAGLIVVVVMVWATWWQWDRLRDGLCGPPGEGADAIAVEPTPGEVTPMEESTAALGDRQAALADAEQRWTEWTGAPPRFPDDFTSPQDCAAVEQELARACDALDAAGYLQAAGQTIGSCRLIRQVAEELARRPPKLASELRSYESILANVFHLFRTLGRPRVEALREIVREEEDHAEPLAMALYRWLVSRETCARSGQTPIRTAPLYDYSSFLFVTMGGQAYLRRRPPEIEALASFYALLLLDRAVERDHNPHGVDPRAEIRRTRELLEARPLVFGDRYRTLLDEMEERWKQRDF
jgi:hypothetical protein